ncbi:MAG: hypothetical protein IPP96_14645 [Chitinophagaceae bacterium]|nr:hypothetical protein [Chitinophagaceae bacterium]
MELDDLKNTWHDISNQADKKQTLTPEMIDDITRNKYHSKIRMIAIPELAGGLICFAAAAYVILNFSLLDTVLVQGAGMVTILLLLGLPVLSWASILQLKMTKEVSKSYADTVKEFAIKKIRFCRLQKLNFTLSYLLLATTILLSTKIFGKNWVGNNQFLFIVSFSFGYIVLLFFSKWVWKRYNNLLRQAEELLKEIGS